MVMVTLGIDVGYGMTKAVCTAHSKSVIFPSVWGTARQAKFDTERGLPPAGDRIADAHGNWFIGDLANSQLVTGEVLRLNGRTIGNTARLRFALAAIAKLLPDATDVINVRIVTGLPVDHMAGAEDLKETFKGSHTIKTDIGEFIVNVVDIIVMPQPYGTLYQSMFTSKGVINPKHIAMRTGVVDVGTYTVDIVLDDDGEFIDSESGSVEAGVFLAQNTIAELINRDYGETPKFYMIQDVLRTGYFKARGEQVDYRQAAQAALEPVRNATTARMRSLWESGLSIDLILIAGGGAELVRDAIFAAEYKQAQVVTDPQLSNARGYLHYALWKQCS